MWWYTQNSSAPIKFESLGEESHHFFCNPGTVEVYIHRFISTHISFTLQPYFRHENCPWYPLGEPQRRSKRGEKIIYSVLARNRTSLVHLAVWQNIQRINVLKLQIFYAVYMCKRCVKKLAVQRELQSISHTSRWYLNIILKTDHMVGRPASMNLF